MSDSLRILVPVDGSSESESILPVIRTLVRVQPSEVTLLRVIEDPDQGEVARGSLQRISCSLSADGIRVVSRLEWGRPVEEIEYLARPERHDLLAMTTHGRSGLARALFGSTAETVLRRATLPVLLNRPGIGGGDWRCIVLALDGSSEAENVLRDLEPIVRVLRATVHVLQVTPPPHALSPGPDPRPYLRSICDRLGGHGIPAIAVTTSDSPAAGITRYLREHRAGLLAMTTRDRSGLARTFVGSVAEEILRESPVPVLLRRVVEMPLPSRRSATA